MIHKIKNDRVCRVSVGYVELPGVIVWTFDLLEVRDEI